MKTNVDYVQKDYYVNESKGTVVCKLLFQIDLDKINSLKAMAWDQRVADYVLKYDPIITEDISEYDVIDEPLGIIFFEVKGQSTCGPKDEFDESLGRKIALTRAQEQAFRVTRDFYAGLYNKYDEVIGDVDDLWRGAANAQKSCKEHSKFLVTEFTAHT